MKIRYSLIVGGLLIIVGLVIGSKSFVNYLEQKNSQPFISAASLAQINKEKTNSSAPTVSGIPTHISIPADNISDNVDPGVYNPKTQTWSLSLTDAEYATVTVPPNNKGGNTFIYGHNRRAVFNRLLDTTIGDEAIVSTANNHTFTYRLVSDGIVAQTNMSLFTYTGKPILTLQTCSGLFYVNRQLFVFDLVSYT